PFHIIIALLLAGGLAFSRTFYVDNSHPPGGDGSFANPFNRINDAITSASLVVLHAGDTLYIRGDLITPRIYTENLHIDPRANSGTPANPIVVRPYGNELVEIRPATAGNLIIMDAGGFVLENLILNHLGTAADVVVIRSSYNVIRNCEVHNGQRDGIFIDAGDGNIIENSRIHDFDPGTPLDAHGVVLDAGVGNIIRNNEIYNCAGDCIQILTGASRWTQILNNHLYTLTPGTSENGVDVKRCVGAIVQGNVVHGFRFTSTSHGEGILVHENADSVTVAANVIYDCAGGIKVATKPEGVPQNIVLERNIIHDLFRDGFLTNVGFGFMIKGVNNLSIRNNTLMNVPGPLFRIRGTGANNLEIRNNLFVNTQDIDGDQTTFTGTVIITYNGYFNSLQLLAGEVNPILGTDPRFVDPISGNYDLAYNSPCIDVGDPTSVVPDSGGLRIDLGAREYTGAVVEREIPAPGVYTFGRSRVSLNVTGDNFTTIRVEMVESGHPQNPGAVATYYRITPVGSGLVDMTLYYDEARLNGNTEGQLRLWRYDGLRWQGPYFDARDVVQNWVRADNIDRFSDWVLSDSLAGINLPPLVHNIPDQTVVEGDTFATVALDGYVSDPDNPDSVLTWGVTGNVELTVSIDPNRIATIAVPSPEWNGSETLVFTATDPGGLSDGDMAVFTVTAVNDPPVVAGIPDQSIAEGGSFAAIALDNYVSDPDNAASEMTWSVTGNTELQVSIDPN
ncbi:MAG: hypothetical protein D6681_20380, partial [Calditrichaeota bacterium]